MMPVELRLSDQRRLLVLTWDDGSTSCLRANLLRSRSRSATAVRAGLEGRVPEPEALTVTEVQPVGSYAVQLSFSDGHDRGIFPFVYLRQLALEPT